MLTTLLMLVMATMAQAQCYIIGNDNNWVTNQAGAELQPTGTEGVYEGEVTFTGQWFFVATKLTEASDDWDGIRPYRWNPGSTDEINIEYNVPVKMASADKGIDGSFMVPDIGVHKMRVDLNEHTVIVYGEYPECIYMLGNDGLWIAGTPAATLQPTDQPGVYRGNVEFTFHNFAFFTTNSADWDELNANRYACNGGVMPNRKYYVQNDPNATCELGRLGTYEVTFDYNDKSIYLYDENYLPECIYFIGDDNGWDLTSSFGFLEKDYSYGEGIFRGQVTFSTPQAFIITTQLVGDAYDWETINKYRIEPANGQNNIVINGHNDVVPNKTEGAFNIGKAGTYYVTVDMRENKPHRLFIYDQEPTPENETRQEIYVIGHDGFWTPWAPGEILTYDSENEVYTGTVNFAGLSADDISYGLFAIIKRTGDWSFVNGERLSPWDDQEPIAVDEVQQAYTDHFNPGAWKFTGAPDSYKMTVSLKDNTVLISTITSDGIGNVSADKTSNGKYYDLSGRRLGTKHPAKGLYIKDGRKVVVK